MKVLVLILMFFILSALLIISNNDLAFYKKENVSKFSGLYLGWIDKLFSNSQLVTGYVVKLKWFPGQDLNTTLT